MKPIIFSTDMVRAILEGRKTQTRRVMKPQPNRILEIFNWLGNTFVRTNLLFRKPCNAFLNGCVKFPYGQVGDRLWVREAFSLREDLHTIHYKADDKEIKWSPYKPSIFMPRWASRISLEITGIRVERLQDIGVRDALAEGVEYDVSVVGGDPVSRYQELWDSINSKKHSWDKNEWVWVIEFKKVESSHSG